MPIGREHRALYPHEWPELSALIRFRRAAGPCEKCGRPHGKQVLHAGGGLWFDRQQGTWRGGDRAEARRPARPYRLRWTFVRLAACHVDRNPTNSDPANLRAWCQRCHVLNDRVEHRRRAAVTILLRRAVVNLVTGPYRSG